MKLYTRLWNTTNFHGDGSLMISKIACSITQFVESKAFSPRPRDVKNGCKSPATSKAASKSKSKSKAKKAKNVKNHHKRTRTAGVVTKSKRSHSTLRLNSDPSINCAAVIAEIDNDRKRKRLGKSSDSKRRAIGKSKQRSVSRFSLKMEASLTSKQRSNLHMIQTSWFQSTESLEDYTFLMNGLNGRESIRSNPINPSVDIIVQNPAPEVIAPNLLEAPNQVNQHRKSLTVRYIERIEVPAVEEKEIVPLAPINELEPVNVLNENIDSNLNHGDNQATEPPPIPILQLIKPLLHGEEYIDIEVQNNPSSPWRFSAALEDKYLQQFVEGFDIVRQYLVQRMSASDHQSGDEIYFDHSSHSPQNNKFSLIQSEGLKCGVHEWSIKLLNSDIFLQEIGVIGVCELGDIVIHKNGLKSTHKCGARALFGSELRTDSMYCGSYDGRKRRQRCFRELSNVRRIGWVIEDVIGVYLDLENYFIRFTLNGKVVSKRMSVEPKQTYYPVICFSGNCQYELL